MTTTHDQDTDTAPTPEEIGENYNHFGDLYGMTIGDVGIHIGLWVPPGERAPATTLGDLANRAQERATEHHIRTLGLKPGAHLLDIGCGTGLPAVRMAQHSGGRTIGITVSQGQLDKARETARAEGVSDRVTFQLGDAMSMDFEDESFDDAMSIDVFAHLSDRQKGFHEAARVLRPGGHFMMSEFTVRGTPTEEHLRAYRQSWCCLAPPTVAQTMEMAETAGFELVQVESMVQNCAFSGELMALLYADRRAEIVQRYGADVVEQMDPVIPVMREFIREHLGSYLFLLRKPVRQS